MCYTIEMNFRNKFRVFPTYEPMAVYNKTFEEWVNKTLEQCILDGKERECHFFDDDIIDHPIVSDYYFVAKKALH